MSKRTIKFCMVTVLWLIALLFIAGVVMLNKKIDDLEYKVLLMEHELGIEREENSHLVQELYNKNVAQEAEMRRMYTERLNLEDKYKELEKKKRVKYNPNDISQISGLTGEEFERLVQGTGLEGIGQDLQAAEESFHVNGMFLIGLAANESGWGKYQIQPNNITGFKAYNSNPKKYAKTFKSKGACILETAKWLNQEYLNEGGKYYNGKRIQDLNKRYAVLNDGSPNPEWSRIINSVAEGRVRKYEKILSTKAK